MNTNTVGERIKRARVVAEMSQKEFAQQVGVDTSTVWRWEKENRPPSSDVLPVIANILGVSVGYLMGEIDTPTDYISVDTSDFNRPVFNHFLEAYKGDEKQAVRAYFEFEKAQAKDAMTETDNPPQPRKQQIESNVRPINKNHATLVKVLGDVKVCCGKGTYWHDEAYEFESEFLMYDPELYRYSPLFAIRAEGDSMEPDIEEEDLVLFTDNIDERQRAGNGDLVIVNYNDRIIIRGLIKTGGKLFLRAYNKEYKDIEIKPEDEFDVLGLVLKVHRVWKPRPMY